MRKRVETSRRIVLASELLFAQYGFEKTTVRMITKTAGVNIAAINYYFKSKDGLIEEFCSLYIDDLIREIRLNYDLFTSTSAKVNSNLLLSVLIRSLVNINNNSIYSIKLLMNVIDYIYNNMNSKIGSSLTLKINNDLKEYIEALREVSNEYDNRIFFWKLNLLVGSIFFTIKYFKSISNLELINFKKETDLNSLLDEMVPLIGVLLCSKNS